jgi:UDP-N-acetylglucosamine--N-acetylmuramyl-(pentapeptide) pyrophosphoryl-undecaprenol N-acetylglucosamine transferase
MSASVMLAAGGTGGHLFPAFALAQELGRRGIAVDLITDMRGDRYGTGFPARAVHRVPSATLAGRSPIAAARTAAMLARGTIAALRIIRQVKPAVVMGFGGYPTLPPLTAARLRRVSSAVHEQNAVLGRANRMLAKGVTAIATSFEHTRLLDGPLQAKARFTGNPVRDVVIAASARPYIAPEPGGPFTLVVFGGSQGARFFSETVPPALAALGPPERGRLRVVQQCREEDLAEVHTAYADAGISAELGPFFPNLPERMSEAHLVIARAGASSVAEITVLGRPSILVPLPHALDNDQLQNATRLAESGGCWCIEQKELTVQRLGTEIARLMQSPDTLVATAAAAGRQGRPDATARLADLIEELMGRKLPCQ